MTDRQASMTAKQERFAVLVAQGLSQSAAYRQAYDAENMKPDQIWQEASRLKQYPRVAHRIDALLREARITDIDSIGRAYRELLDDLEAARSAGNATAVAQLQRLRLQCLGMLRDRLVVSAESSLSDEQLIRRLSGDDPRKAALLREILPPDSFETRH